MNSCFVCGVACIHVYCSLSCSNRGRFKKRFSEYLKNPKLCKRCGVVITYKKSSENTYCSRKCSAIENNGGVEKPPIACLTCGVFMKRREYAYCSQKCGKEGKYRAFISRWKNGEESGVVGSGTSARIYRYLRETRGNKCQLCNWQEINPTTGKVPIQLEHVDGNWQNNLEDNLLLLCPNCHSLTPTYGALNKGNGRSFRRIKVLSTRSLVVESDLAKIGV